MQGRGAGGAPRVKPRRHLRNWAMSPGAEELTSSFTFYLLRCFPFPRVRLASSGVVWGGLTTPFTPNLIII